MWASARRHRLAESKANMRGLHFSTLLEQDVIPGPFLGADKLPRYLLNEKGALSPAMSTLIRTQSIERTKLAIDELRETESSAARRAKYYNGITEQLYQQEGDGTYNEAANLQTSLVVHFKQIEAKRLQSLFNKEIERKPADDVELARLICRPQEELAGKPQAKAAKRPRQPSTHREETTSKNSRPSNQAPRQDAQAAPQAQQRQSNPPTNSRGGYMGPSNRQGGYQGKAGQQNRQTNSNIRGRQNYRGQNHRGQNSRGQSNSRSSERRPSPPRSPSDPIERTTLTRQQKDLLDVLRGLIGKQ